jgi:tRNA pseudouridine55 synthase
MTGFLNVHKPAGMTSHDVVARLRRLLGVQRIGHTGTLDPSATGVLPICIGAATRLSRFFLEMDKTYRAVVQFGVATDTQDASGRVVSRHPTDHLTEREVRGVLEGFVGEQEQVVPMYSAVKIQGEPLYRSARAGIEVERPVRRVTIKRLEVEAVELPSVRFTVTCSKGTYIRTLCADAGERLGVGAHLARLERIRVGPFDLSEAMTIEEAERRFAEGRLEQSLHPPEAALSALPHLRVDEATVRSVRQGRPILARGVVSWPERFSVGETVAIHGPSDRLIAIGLARIGSEETGRSSPSTTVFSLSKVF